MRTKPTCIQKTVIATSKLFMIEQMHLRFSNGAERIFERIRGHSQGAVLIIPLTTKGSLLLVREYAAGTDSYELAFPKGLIEKGESPIEAANRELREEVGFAANQLTLLKSVSLAPSYFGARMDLVLARDLYPSALEGDEPEPLEILEWPLTDYEELLARPDFSEARSIAALFLVKHWLNEEKHHE